MIDKPIYFLHIPKTSGTSVTAYISQSFSSTEIFPYQRWDLAFKEKTTTKLTKILDQNKYKFYHGHFGYHPKFTDDKFVFTMLRNPSNRTISQYKHMVKFPQEKGWFQYFFRHKDESLKSILQDPTRAYLITNIQTKYLSATIDPLKTKRPKRFIYDESQDFIRPSIVNPKKSLFKAITNLLKIDFFGLQEYNEESMLMLADKLRIHTPLLTERKQYFDNESFSNQLDTQTQNLLFHTNNLDNKLYFIARYVFEKRLLNFINQKSKVNIGIYKYLSNRRKYLIKLKSVVLK